MLTLKELNQLPEIEFTNILGSIFEHSPWVAKQTYEFRPFSSVDSLLQYMFDLVKESPQADRLKLICNHPQLAGKEAEQGSLTEHSKNEQDAAGLNHCTAEELAQLQTLNQQYLDKFGFPFVIAVKGLTRHDILAAMQQRIDNPLEQEFDACIDQIGRIAEFRLKELITD
jgi:2-oxo-4-hydroxy-4-carboxy-5-ureidoimidazoline decarboxylase